MKESNVERKSFENVSSLIKHIRKDMHVARKSNFEWNFNELILEDTWQQGYSRQNPITRNRLPLQGIDRERSNVTHQSLPANFRR